MKPKVIVLCGSTRFIELFAVTAWLLEKNEGCITLGLHFLPWWYATKEEIPDHLAEHENVKEQMDELHMRKIDMADTIFVINQNNYIGNSTRREITYAQKLNVPIRWFSHDEIGKQVNVLLQEAMKKE